MFVKVILFVGDMYISVLAVFLVVRFFVGKQWEFIALCNNFLHLLLLPTLIWFPICVIYLRWTMVFVSVLPVLTFVASYGIMFIPKTKVANSIDSELKILTYNIHAEQSTLNPMVTLVRSSEADVVALQELTTAAADQFINDLALIYPYSAFHTTPDVPVLGQGFLSRYPIIVDDYWHNDFLPAYLAHQRVQIDVNGTVVTIYNTHPFPPRFGRAGHLSCVELHTRELETVLSRAGQDTTPILIVGDFNMADQSNDYQRISATYRDTYREVGWGMGFTFPNSNISLHGFSLSLVRLDYVFHSPAFQALEARVWPTTGGSDHHPVFATFALPKTDVLDQKPC